MKCAQCEAILPTEPVWLEHGGDPVPLCSLECVVVYSVEKIQQRLRHRTEFVERLRRSAGVVRAAPRSHLRKRP